MGLFCNVSLITALWFYLIVANALYREEPCGDHFCTSCVVFLYCDIKGSVMEIMRMVCSLAPA